MKTSLFLAGLAVSFALCLGAAQAQDAPAAAAAPAPAANSGGSTCPPAAAGTEVKCVQDWQVRCFKVQGQSRCDMYQELADKNTQQPLLSLSVAYIPTMNRRAIQILVPLMVSIPKGLKVITDSYTSPVLKYTSCERTGCYVAAIADDAFLQGLARSGPSAKVQITTDSGREIPIDFSLRGFSQALDLMTAQTKAKAAAAATPAKP